MTWSSFFLPFTIVKSVSEPMHPPYYLNGDLKFLMDINGPCPLKVTILPASFPKTGRLAFAWAVACKMFVYSFDICLFLDYIVRDTCWFGGWFGCCFLWFATTTTTKTTEGSPAEEKNQQRENTKRNHHAGDNRRQRVLHRHVTLISLNLTFPG